MDLCYVLWDGVDIECRVMKIVDQVDAKKFNDLAGVLSRLGLVTAWATIMSSAQGNWWSGQDIPLTMFDERWVVIVQDFAKNIHAEYEV